MMRKVAVYEHTTGRGLPAGELVSERSRSGSIRCQFRYADAFLARRDAFALDPVGLPLGKGAVEAHGKPLFDAFEDSLPDDWGRRLLLRQRRLPREGQDPLGLLLALGADGLGALSFHESGAGGGVPDKVLDREPAIMDLDGLLLAAARYESGDEGDPLFSMLLSAGSSPGGARPKVLVFDRERGVHCIAKFPSISDRVDVVRIEGASMQLASDAGLRPAPSMVIDCGGKPVLLVERFDLVPGGRRHMLSFRTLLQAEGYYIRRYGDLSDALRSCSRDPRADTALLFRQMVFNALLGNTDDHLKNFWMVYGRKEGWRLSPAIDLVPDIAGRGEHVLFFDLDPVHPGRGGLEEIGLRWGVSMCREIVDEVYRAVGGWRQRFLDCGVREDEIELFRRIDDRLAR